MSRPAGSAARPSAASTTIAARSRCRQGSAPRALFPDRRLDQLDRVVARPFGGAGDGADLAALFVDQQGGRHAEGAADLLQVLERLGGRIGVIGELLDAQLLQPGL